VRGELFSLSFLTGLTLGDDVYIVAFYGGFEMTHRTALKLSIFFFALSVALAVWSLA